MSPQSLLFSSDEETSRRLTQALQELELQVVRCSEIFDAVEKITTRSYDVIVADWDDGVEATFLLKTTRELKLNSGAFTMAVAKAPEAHAAARQVGANLVLGKPIVPEHAKMAMLTNDDFLRAMRNWLPKLLPNQTSSNQPAQVTPGAAERPANSSPARITPRATSSDSGAADKAARVGLWPYATKSAKSKPASRPAQVLLTVALGVAFFSVGYVFSEPARGAAAASSVTRIYERAVEKTAGWLQAPYNAQTAPPEIAQLTDAQARRADRRIKVTPVYEYSGTPPKPAIKPESQPQPPAEPEVKAAAVHIPDSLKSPIDSPVSVRNVAARITPSLMGALEPVNLPEDLAQRLILQKVDPSYPEQALRAGLQGPVVLQAWISRDGSIRELKLLRGSLLLGQAAYQAVKQWRYKPYQLNGQAVEAQTLVTVDFRLPQ
jgi:TonB family protein